MHVLYAAQGGKNCMLLQLSIIMKIPKFLACFHRGCSKAKKMEFWQKIMILYSTVYVESRAVDDWKVLQQMLLNSVCNSVHSKSTRHKGYSWARGKLILLKNLKPKILCKTPFKGSVQ
jgi:hypothetical protein